ncbi:uncharacterized protein LOC144160619 [Haemaphysalis longicornis]
MLSAGNSASATGRGTTSSGNNMGTYKIILARLPTGNVVLNTVFLHADLKGRRYRAPDFRDALARVINLRDVLCIGQYQMSHVWMVTCVSSAVKQKLVQLEKFIVKGLQCMVFDPDTKNVKMKLLWVPRHMENRRVTEAFEPFGTTQSITREMWRCPGMDHMETGAREVSLTLKDGVSVSDVPHMMDIYGSQCLVLVPGRPPFCLRCSRIGHVRRQCRTPRCNECRRYGHTAERCVMTYAEKLRHGQESTTEDDVSDNVMDVTEVVDASGEVGQSVQSENPEAWPQDSSAVDRRELEPYPVPPDRKRQHDSQSSKQNREEEMDTHSTASNDASGEVHAAVPLPASDDDSSDASCGEGGDDSFVTLPSASWADAVALPEDVPGGNSGSVKRPAPADGEDKSSSAGKKQASNAQDSSDMAVLTSGLVTRAGSTKPGKSLSSKTTRKGDTSGGEKVA